jgi:thiol:disulfide interchange protein DsbC
MRLVPTLSLALLLAASAPVAAGPAKAPPALDQVRKAFALRFPNVPATEFRPTPVPGIYEVTIGVDVFYVSADARYVVRGTLMDVEHNEDLRERRQAEIRRTLIAAVPDSQFIVFREGTPKHSVTVLTDVDCAYCRKLHASIGEYTKRGIEIRYLFFPRTGLGTESWQKAQDVWCSKDRNAALTLAKRGQPLPHGNCDTAAVVTGYRLGETLRLDGTPMIIASDGHQIGGYLTPDEMLQKLEALATKSRSGG